ncbi:MAG TPA: hypothetical protein VN687_05595 [Blastocatellia bacterium]|nr:hypothetical protein [Blastocatellia bacterium]
MRIFEVIWKDRFVDKIADKHGVTTDEVEQVLSLLHTCDSQRKDTYQVRIFMSRTDNQTAEGI